MRNIYRQDVRKNQRRAQDGLQVAVRVGFSAENTSGTGSGRGDRETKHTLGVLHALPSCGSEDLAPAGLAFNQASLFNASPTLPLPSMRICSGNATE